MPRSRGRRRAPAARARSPAQDARTLDAGGQRESAELEVRSDKSHASRRCDVANGAPLAKETRDAAPRCETPPRTERDSGSRAISAARAHLQRDDTIGVCTPASSEMTASEPALRRLLLPSILALDTLHSASASGGLHERELRSSSFPACHLSAFPAAPAAPCELGRGLDAGAARRGRRGRHRLRQHRR